MKPETFGSYKPECRLFAVSTHGRAVVEIWQFTGESCFILGKNLAFSLKRYSSFLPPCNICADSNMEA
jgi:hypothetical protein